MSTLIKIDIPSIGKQPCKDISGEVSALVGAQDLVDECEWQILARAMRDPDDIKVPYSADVDEVRDLLNDDERLLLARCSVFLLVCYFSL